MSNTDTIFDHLAALPNPNLDRQRNAWVARHNAAILDYLADKVGATMRGGSPVRITPAEAGILAMAEGIYRYVRTLPDRADPLSGECMFSMIEGFRGLLNYDLGRLDGGTLSSWAHDTLVHWGVNPDTGEWVGGA